MVEHRIAASESGSRTAVIGLVGALVVTIVPLLTFAALRFAAIVGAMVVVDIELVMAGAVAVVAVRALRAGRARTVWACALLGPVLIAAVPGLEPFISADTATLAAQERVGSFLAWGAAVDTGTTVLWLIGVFLLTVVALAIYVARQSRSGMAFVIAFLVWMVPTVVGVGNQTLGRQSALQLAATPVGYDLCVTFGIAVLSLIAVRRGLPQGLLSSELLVLLVVVTAVAYGDVVAGFLPASWQAVLAPLALISPIVAQFTVDAGPLNIRAPTRPGSIIGVIGITGLALALACSLVALAGTAAFQQADIAALARPVFTMPFAVVLVAATSASGALAGTQH